MRRGTVLGVVALTIGWVPLLPLPARTANASTGPAVYAASAEAWAYSVEAGVPGPIGPLASHTTAAVDNSPHATGAAGLADPGYLVRAAAGLVLGVPTPAYCESAWPEGPDQADCSPLGDGQTLATSATRADEGPDATATASAGQVTAEAVSIAAQTTTSTAGLEDDGSLRARADVTLSGVAIAGGALRLGTVAVHREAIAGTPDGPTTSSAIELTGMAVGGVPVDAGSDPIRSLVEATRAALGDTLVVEALGGNETRTDAGQLHADTSGLRITWRPQPDRSVQIVLGYGRVSVYTREGPATPPVQAPTAATAGQDAGSGSHGSGLGSAPSVAAPPGPAGATDVVGPPLPTHGSSDLPAHGARLAPPATPPVRWVSPFLVLEQMTNGGQLWWLLFGLTPLFAGGWLARRGGMGLLAPWVAAGRSRSQS